VYRQAAGRAIDPTGARDSHRQAPSRLRHPRATGLFQAISRARITMMMAPMAATTICSIHSLPKLSFQPAALKTKPPTKPPLRPVIMWRNRPPPPPTTTLASQPATMPIPAQITSCWAFMFMALLPGEPPGHAHDIPVDHAATLTDSSDHVEALHRR